MTSVHSESPRKSFADTLSRFLFVLAMGSTALLALYVGAYFSTGSRTVGGPREFQGYRYKWQAVLFEPAVKVESAVRRKPIDLGWRTFPDDPTR